MIEKKQILTFGYHRFIVPNNICAETLAKQLMVLQTCDWLDKRTNEPIEISVKVELVCVKPTDDEEHTDEPL